MFGLTALAAVAAMAFVGVSAAMATGETALCEVNELVCPAESIYEGHLEGLAVNPTLTGTFVGIKGTFTCKHSLILGNSLGLEKSHLTHIEAIKFTSCHLLAPFVNQSCTVESKALGLIDLLKTATNLGEATSLGNTVYIKCGGGGLLECTLGGEPKFHAKGATLDGEGKVTALATLTSPEGGAVVTAIEGERCPSNPRWNAKYTIQLPHDIYITL